MECSNSEIPKLCCPRGIISRNLLKIQIHESFPRPNTGALHEKIPKGVLCKQPILRNQPLTVFSLKSTIRFCWKRGYSSSFYHYFSRNSNRNLHLVDSKIAVTKKSFMSNPLASLEYLGKMRTVV